ncbi:MAG: 4-(cytidine 5'-diphospho)-2-C-methyl-D-erythritol kinase, partial [Nitrospinae bacterium]|nr:4-(cytidine 5'-diphospho)-2-C-methyl-D-erythritol kinase [Nitrospinota bacterium]
MRKINIKSPSKINLGLKVIGRRDDGYHDVETVFQMINLCDDVVLTESSYGITLYSDCKDIPFDERNLAYRAAQLLLKETGIKKGVKIEIYKNIPISAGLGGGSSNAAVTLLGLNYVLDLQLSRDELFPIAMSLGADVPFFLSGPQAFGTGRGDKLQNLSCKERFYILLLNPHIPISTAWVYENLNLELTKEMNNIKILKFNDSVSS